MLEASTKFLFVPVTPVSHSPNHPAPHIQSPTGQGEEHRSCCQRAELQHCAETTAESRARILLRPTALGGWSHPFTLPPPAILCLMQSDATIKIDDPQPPSPAQWALVGWAQSLCSAAAHGQVLQGLCFSVPLIIVVTYKGKPLALNTHF